MSKISYLSFKSAICTKNTEKENYVIEGYANVYDVIDNHNEIIKSEAFEPLDDTGNIKFLWQHMPDKPIGKILNLSSDDKGLFMKAELDCTLNQGVEAASMIESGIIDGLSIGFEVLEHSYEDSIRIITKAKLWEVSVVTFPANKYSIINKNEERKMVKSQILEERLDDLERIMNRPAMEHKAIDNSMKLFIKTGDVSLLETKAGLTSADDSAGHSITPAFNKRIFGALEALSPMRKLCSVERISSNVLELLIEGAKFNSGWIAESDARADTDSANITKKQIHVHELFAQPKATQRLLDDSEVNIENWLVSRLRDSFLRVENESFITGDGNGKPKGILGYPENQITRITSGDGINVTFEDLLSLIEEMPEQYLRNASFLMHRSSIMHIRKLKDDTGRFIWQPSAIAGEAETIFGIPVYSCEEMPLIGADSMPIVLADFKDAYKIVDRKDITIMRDPYTEKPFVKFYATKRIGGDVVNKEAIKILEIKK